MADNTTTATAPEAGVVTIPPLVVEVAGQTRTLGERVARQVYVTRTRRSRSSAPSTSPAGSAPGPAGN